MRRFVYYYRCEVCGCRVKSPRPVPDGNRLCGVHVLAKMRPDVTPRPLFPPPRQKDQD